MKSFVKHRMILQIAAAVLLALGTARAEDEVYYANLHQELLGKAPRGGDLFKASYYPSYSLLRVRLAPDKMVILNESLLKTPDGKPGLQAEFFGNTKLEGEPLVTQVIPEVNLGDTGTPKSPAHGVPNKGFSSRFTGTIGPLPHPIKLCATVTDGVRLWIDDELVLDDWNGRWPPKNLQAKTILQADRSYKLRMENFTIGHQICQLGYQFPDELTKPMKSAEIGVVAPDGTVLLADTLQWQGNTGEGTFEVEVAEAGTYVVTAKLDGMDAPIIATFTREFFPWEGNRLGITNRIYPPFEPIAVDGNVINVVLRSHTVNGLGLWDSVKAAGNVSAGGPEELLAGPVTLRVNDGQALQGAGKFVTVKPHEVVYEGRAAHRGVTVKTRTTTEYDGCMKVEMELLPGTAQEELQALWLEIPLKDDMAPLWHVTPTGIRSNPSGNVPGGGGVVWDSRTDIPEHRPILAGPWHTNFNCYYWFGAEERGLAWFADNDRNWVLNMQDGKHVSPAQEIIRRDGQLILKVNFVQRPITITEPRTIVFGMIASPVKPMPENWRRTLFEGSRPGYARIGWVGSQYWGSDEHFAAKYPRNGDLSVLSKMQEARLAQNAGNAPEYLKIWKLHNLHADQPRFSKEDEQMANLVQWSINHASRADANTRYCVYWEEFVCTSPSHPEYETFGTEWDGGIQRRMTGGITPSYRDFAVWYGAEFVRRGIGLYFDNSFPERAYDPITTTAYRLEDGRIQPTGGIWARREYLKRIWTIHQQLTPAETPTIMMIHMTNTHMTPYMGWNDSNLDMEYYEIAIPMQARFHHSMMRAQGIGRQTGNWPLALANVGREETPEQKQFALRTRFGILAVHEIQGRMYESPYGQMFGKLLDFGYGLDDCNVYNYWDRNYPLAASNDDVKTLLLSRNGEVMIVVCTWNGEAEQVKLALDTQVLGTDLKKARNAENQETIPFDGKTIALDLEGYGVRILHVK